MYVYVCHKTEVTHSLCFCICVFVCLCALVFVFVCFVYCVCVVLQQSVCHSTDGGHSVSVCICVCICVFVCIVFCVLCMRIAQVCHSTDVGHSVCVFAETFALSLSISYSLCATNQPIFTFFSFFNLVSFNNQETFPYAGYQTSILVLTFNQNARFFFPANFFFTICLLLFSSLVLS